MCTLVILRRPDHPWPLIVGANRDEHRARPWQSPARHWPDRADVTAGLDTLAGGTWLGVNDYAVVAAVLNRPGTLGPATDKRSRGELPLEALDHAEARAAAEALAHLDPDAYRPFNLFIGDARDAFWIAARPGQHPVEVSEIGPGLSMLTAHGLGDEAASARQRHHRPRFAAAPPPNPDTDDWAAWQTLLESRETAPDGNPESAMLIDSGDGFGTSSSSLIALPRAHFEPGKPALSAVWRFRGGQPEITPWETVVF